MLGLTYRRRPNRAARRSPDAAGCGPRQRGPLASGIEPIGLRQVRPPPGRSVSRRERRVAGQDRDPRRPLRLRGFRHPGGKGRKGPPRDHRELCRGQGQCPRLGTPEGGRPVRVVHGRSPCGRTRHPADRGAGLRPSTPSRPRPTSFGRWPSCRSSASPARWAATWAPTRRSRTSTFSRSPKRAWACRTAITTGMPSSRRSWTAYQAYIERMLTLAKIGDAKQAAADIVALETRIAKAQWSKVENRNADKTYNKMGLAELAKLAPGFDWQLYFQTIGVKDVKEVVVSPAVLPHGDGQAARQGPAGDLEGLAEVQRRPSLREPAQQGVGGRGLRVLRHDPPRRSAKPPPLEAGRLGRRGRLPGRGGGQAVRREAVPAGSQAAHGPDGQERAGGLSDPAFRTWTG